MKKKILVMTLAIVLCLSVSTTAFATSNPSPVGGSTSIVSEVPDGVHIVEQPMTAEKQEAINDAIAQNNVEGTLLLTQDIHLEYTGGMTYFPSAGDPPIVFKMYCSVHPYDKATIIHITQAGQVEIIPATCYEGYVEFGLTSFSPVGLVVQAGTAPASGDSSSTTTTAAAVSPKTSEAANTSAIWYIVAAAAAVVLVSSIRMVRRAGKEK